ncbi:phosphoglycerate mutase [Clostridia bacterium]|nr:phosphoglycerate mutase [Clostridia bacterium]
MIYLVRQGQTDWNLFKRCNGITETFLNQTGIEQSESQAERLKGVKFDACFCSPQKRTRQTCEIIYKDAIIFDDRLAEIICGEFEGMEENAEMMESFWKAAADGEKGTEKIDSFMKRNFDFCDMVRDEHKGENVLIVTHAANIRAISYYFLGKPKDFDLNKTPIKSGELITFEN